MVLLGGATRLTDSGLSITEWKPLIGAIPPLSEADWQTVFSKYQKIPEYSQVNEGMSLADFKRIFWWEWSHRFLGRLIGLALVLPWLLLTLMGRIPKDLQPKLGVMLVLGGLQGLMGWYMVKSGLVDRIDVSQYRLAAHLMLAAIIIAYISWVVLSLQETREFALVLPLISRDVWIAGALLVLLFVQIGLGALVAGLHAGLSHNTWPLMDGDFIPEGLFDQTPVLVNLFENIMTVQFDHRLMAYLVLALALLHGFQLIGKSDGLIKASTIALLGTVFFQIILGIFVLVLVVPFSLAIAHQGLAFVTFILAVRHLYLLKTAYGRQ
ncbi:MAG: COX15/CtaA family protein [Hyphomicrobiaceae bacterium]|nr:COX15/CtaA family protein [Hyphomicrobiaceae bacterium]